MSANLSLVFILWLIIAIMFFASALPFFVWQNQAKEEPTRRRILLLVAFLFISLGLSRLFHLISYLNNNDQFLFAINQLFLIVALIVIIYSFEKKISGATKNIFTIALIITEILYLIFHLQHVTDWDNPNYIAMDNTFSLILAITMVISGFYILILYLKMFLQASGIVRRKALYIILGIFFLIASYGLSIFESVLPIEVVAVGMFICSVISVPALIAGYK